MVRPHAGAVRRHGGRVQKFVGDAVVAVFGIPVVNEDDALRAVRAAAELRRGLEPLNDELERDIGVRLEVRTRGQHRRGGHRLRGDALLDLAVVAAAAARPDDAARAAGDALELFRAKGNRPGAARAEAALGAAKVAPEAATGPGRGG